MARPWSLHPKNLKIATESNSARADGAASSLRPKTRSVLGQSSSLIGAVLVARAEFRLGRPIFSDFWGSAPRSGRAKNQHLETAKRCKWRQKVAAAAHRFLAKKSPKGGKFLLKFRPRAASPSRKGRNFGIGVSPFSTRRGHFGV